MRFAGTMALPRSPRRVVLWAVLAVALALQAPLRQAVESAKGAAPAATPLYLSSGRLLRDLSLGYNGLLADIYWTRAVQYYGRERLESTPQLDSLGTLLRITTTLDPHLLVAYRFGAVFLAEKPPAGAGEPEEALQLLRRGIVANPGYWRLWQDLGFIYYWDLRDYASAARAFRTGSERPGAEIWMKTLAATVAAQGGEIRTSQVLWAEIYRTAENDSIRKSALEHLAALKTWQEMQELDRLLTAYQNKTGHVARSFRDLMGAGWLRALPRDPSGAPFMVGRNGKTRLGPGSKIDLSIRQ